MRAKLLVDELNEIFGLSKEEKSKKQRSLDILKVKEEILKYNWAQLVAQPGNNAGNKDLLNLINIRINTAKTELPTLYKLVPELFELDDRGTNAATCYFQTSSGTFQGIIPANFGFIVDPRTRLVTDDDETKQRALDFITRRYLNH